ncbi:MAG: hypothetical protein Q9181_005883 [Wetmoreana brouardii]
MAAPVGALPTLHELSVSLDLLPITSPSQLLPLLNIYLAPSAPAHPPPAIPSSRALLRRVTAAGPTRPLSEHSANVLSDICHSMGEVATMTSSEQGMKALEDFLGEADAENIESFWAEEWICD